MKKMIYQILILGILFMQPQFVFAQSDGYIKRGTSFYKKGDYDKAIVEFTKAIQDSPNNADAYYTRGLMYWIQGKDLESKSDFKKSAQLDAKYNEVFLDLPNAGKFNQDITAYTDVINKNPGSSEAYLNRGRIYAQHYVISRNKSEYSNALSDYDKAVKLDSKNEDAIANRQALITNKNK